MRQHTGNQLEETTTQLYQAIRNDGIDTIASILNQFEEIQELPNSELNRPTGWVHHGSPAIYAADEGKFKSALTILETRPEERSRKVTGGTGGQDIGVLEIVFEQVSLIKRLNNYAGELSEQIEQYDSDLSEFISRAVGLRCDIDGERGSRLLFSSLCQIASSRHKVFLPKTANALIDLGVNVDYKSDGSRTTIVDAARGHTEAHGDMAKQLVDRIQSLLEE